MSAEFTSWITTQCKKQKYILVLLFGPFCLALYKFSKYFFKASNLRRNSFAHLEDDTVSSLRQYLHVSFDSTTFCVIIYFTYKHNYFMVINIIFHILIRADVLSRELTMEA